MIKCQYCELSYPTQPKLDNHVKAKHDYFCYTCKRQFSSKKSITNHMKNFHSEKELKCVECDITFDRETQLKKHNLVKHSTGPKQQCSICQKSFLTKINLANHIRYAHKENDESKCEQHNS